MTNKNTMKRSLIAAVLALALCFTALVGTTFAWFTSTVTSGINEIQSGNLDISLEYYDGKTWQNVKGSTELFDKDAKWEPGHTEVVYLKIANTGSLTADYRFGINIVNEVAGVNFEDETFLLSDYIFYDVIEGKQPGAYATREDAIAAASLTNKISASYTRNDILAVGPKAVYLAMIVHMPETVDNVANHNGVTLPKIQLGLSVTATQTPNEEDAFGPDYDADALYCDVLATPATIDEILASATEGMIIGLAKGTYGTITVPVNNLTLVSKSAVVGAVNLNAKDGVVLDGITFDAASATATYTFESGNIQTATGYVANVTGDTNSPDAADGAVIKNCTFTGTATDVTKYVPIYFNEVKAATERATNLTVSDCVFACDAYQYLVLNYLSEGTTVISGNTFGGNGFGTGHNTINATGNSSNFVITDNSFNNWNIGKTAIGSSYKSGKVTWTITGNNFNNQDGAVALALKTSYTAANTVLVVENNTAFNGNGVLVSTPVNAENETVYGGHKLAANAGVTVVAPSTGKVSASNNSTVYLLDGNHSLNTLSGVSGATIVGADGAVIGGDSASTGFAWSNFGKDTTIKNLTFAGTSNGVRWSYANGGTTVFEDCTFAGDSTYGFHIDQSNGATFIFKNCTFSGFNAFAGDLVSVTFENCTFLHNGNYGHTNIWSTAYFNNCTWGEGATFSGADSNSAIYIDGVLQ